MITWQREIGPNNIVRLSEDTHVHSTSTDETMSCNVSVQQSVIEISSSRAEDGVEYICQAQNDHPNIVASKRLRIAVQSGSIIVLAICITITTKINTTVLDECTSSPCQNGGVCVDEYLAFSCNCVGTNHTGNQCQEPGEFITMCLYPISLELYIMCTIIIMTVLVHAHGNGNGKWCKDCHKYGHTPSP